MSLDKINDKVITANFTDINFSTRIAKDILIDESAQNNIGHAYNQLKNNLNAYLEEVKKIQQDEERSENAVISATLKRFTDIYKNQYTAWSELGELKKSIDVFERNNAFINNDTIGNVNNTINSVSKQMMSTITKIYNSEDVKVLYFTDVNIEKEKEMVNIIKRYIYVISVCYQNIKIFEKGVQPEYSGKKYSEIRQKIKKAIDTIQFCLNNLKTKLIKCLYNSYNVLIDQNNPLNKKARVYASYYLQSSDNPIKDSTITVNKKDYRLPLPFDFTNVNIIAIRYIINYSFDELIKAQLSINTDNINSAENNTTNDIFFKLLDYIIDLKECKSYEFELNGSINRNINIEMYINKLYLVSPHIIFDFCLNRFDEVGNIDIRQSARNMNEIYKQLGDKLYEDLSIKDDDNKKDKSIERINSNIVDEVSNVHIKITQNLINMMIYGVANPKENQPIKGSIIDVYARLWEGDITGTNTVKQLNTLQDSPFTLEDTKILWNRFTNKIAGFVGGIDYLLNIARILSPIILVAVIVLFILVNKDIIPTNSWKSFWQMFIIIAGTVFACCLFIIGLIKDSKYIMVCNFLTLVASMVCLCYWFYSKGKEDGNNDANAKNEGTGDIDNNTNTTPEEKENVNNDANTPTN